MCTVARNTVCDVEYLCSMAQGNMKIVGPRDPWILFKEKQLKGFCSLVKFGNGVMLLGLQALDDNIKVGDFRQQKSHIGQVVRTCYEA